MPGLRRGLKSLQASHPPHRNKLFESELRPLCAPWLSNRAQRQIEQMQNGPCREFPDPHQSFEAVPCPSKLGLVWQTCWDNTIGFLVGQLWKRFRAKTQRAQPDKLGFAPWRLGAKSDGHRASSMRTEPLVVEMRMRGPPPLSLASIFRPRLDTSTGKSVRTRPLVVLTRRSA